jgi:K+-transporting ATPase KdpF subunit
VAARGAFALLLSTAIAAWAYLLIVRAVVLMPVDPAAAAARGPRRAAAVADRGRDARRGAGDAGARLLARRAADVDARADVLSAGPRRLGHRGPHPYAALMQRGRFLMPARSPRRRSGVIVVTHLPPMTTILLVLLVVACFVYLLVAMLRPEKF